MKFNFVFASAIILTSVMTNAQSPKWPDVKPPVAEKISHLRIIHNDTVADDYYWMIDYFKKGPNSEKVIAYLNSENDYTKKMMAGTEKFQDLLFNEMKSRIKEKDESVPVFKNGYYYYTRTEEGKQYYKYCRKKGSLSAPEEILLDVDKMSEGHSYFAVSGFEVSEDNNYLAYATDTVSRRQYFIRIKDLKTGKDLPDIIQSSNGNIEWASDNKTLFYTYNNPETLLSEKIKKHKIGDDSVNDAVVYHEKDKTNYIGVFKSKNNKYIFISSEGTLSSELRFIESSKPTEAFKVFQPRMKDVIYNVTALENKFLIYTNKDAKNFKIMETPLNKTSVENWKDFIGHRPDVLVKGVDEFKDFLVIYERKNGLVEFRVIDRKTNNEHYINFNDAAYTAAPAGNPEYSSSEFRYRYSSLVTPPATYDYNMQTHNQILLKQQEVLGGFNAEDYKTERVYATATDGTKIPISIVYRNDFQKNGKAPLLLYAYGSYGFSMDASFSSSRISLLDRGFAFAIAHIRGGEEMGREWYESGKMMNKKNTFTDFINAAEYLIGEKFTSSKHLYAMGGSAGGLLMGAVANMAPDLFNGIIAAVPFVDVVNTMLDESIPLTTNEYDEWGNPNNKDAYDYMKSYSPYENVEKKDYPNMLVTTGLHDSQVQYFEPAKWVAKLRSMKTGNSLLLLHTNMEFGHGGASGRFDYLKNVALEYAFMLTLEGINK